MKKYSLSTLRSLKKVDLIRHIINLQENYEICEKQNEHMYLTIVQALKNNPELREEIGKVLDIWNKSNGTSYGSEENITTKSINSNTETNNDIGKSC